MYFSALLCNMHKSQLYIISIAQAHENVNSKNIEIPTYFSILLCAECRCDLSGKKRTVFRYDPFLSFYHRHVFFHVVQKSAKWRIAVARSVGIRAKRQTKTMP
jgi:hypothetical protein